MEGIGFDSEKFVKLQSDKIKSRLKNFDNKMYLDFGGKIFDDYHASRVLPGYTPDNKVRVLTSFKDDLEIIICVSAKDIITNKIRADFDITYDKEVFRLIENLTSICYRTLDERGNKCIYTLVRFDRQEGFKRFARLEDIVAVFQDHNSTVKVEEFEIGVDEDLSPIALDGFWVKVTTKDHGWLHVYFNKNNGQLEWY